MDAVSHLGLVPVKGLTGLFVVPIERKTLFLLLRHEGFHIGSAVIVRDPKRGAGADSRTCGKVSGAFEGRKRLIEVIDGCGHREHRTGTRLLGGIGKPGGAG